MTFIFFEILEVINQKKMKNLISNNFFINSM